MLLRKVKVSDPDSVSELHVDELIISPGSRAAAVVGDGASG